MLAQYSKLHNDSLNGYLAISIFGNNTPDFSVLCPLREQINPHTVVKLLIHKTFIMGSEQPGAWLRKVYHHYK